MSETPQLYTPEWHARHAWTRSPARRCLLEQFKILGVPASLLDVGCAEGQLVQDAIEAGVTMAAGLDIAATMARTMRVDLAMGFDVGATFSQVTCWEVAEHLPKSSASLFVRDLAKHVEDWLVFTAAPPGQGGEGHVNEQPQLYWRSALCAQGLFYRSLVSAAMARVWKDVCGPCWWYPKNVQVFSREPS